MHSWYQGQTELESLHTSDEAQNLANNSSTKENSPPFKNPPNSLDLKDDIIVVPASPKKRADRKKKMAEKVVRPNYSTDSLKRKKKVGLHLKITCLVDDICHLVKIYPLKQ